jgi:hypothetical protein
MILPLLRTAVVQMGMSAFFDGIKKNLLAKEKAFLELEELLDTVSSKDTLAFDMVMRIRRASDMDQMRIMDSLTESYYNYCKLLETVFESMNPYEVTRLKQKGVVGCLEKMNKPRRG